jgi:hypothetical protein
MAQDVLSSAPGEFARLRLASAEIAFDVLTPFTVDVDTLEAGDVVVLAWAEVLEAFDAGTTNVLVLGTTGTADAFLAAGDVTEGTPGASAAKGPFAAAAAETLLKAKFTQTGTPAEAGSARVYALIASAPA